MLLHFVPESTVFSGIERKPLSVQSCRQQCGNAHDSNGAEDFILACIREIRSISPRAVVEVRMDSAFFSDAIVDMLDTEGVEFSISVPFERFTELKSMIEGRRRWRESFSLFWENFTWII